MEWSRIESVYNFFWGVGGVTSLKRVSAGWDVWHLFKMWWINFQDLWVPKKDNIQHIDIFFSPLSSATLDSAVTDGKYGAKHFTMRTGKDVVSCVYFENVSPTVPQLSDVLFFLNGSVPLSTFGCISLCILLSFLMMHLFAFLLYLTSKWESSMLIYSAN